MSKVLKMKAIHNLVLDALDYNVLNVPSSRKAFTPTMSEFTTSPLVDSLFLFHITSLLRYKV